MPEFSEALAMEAWEQQSAPRSKERCEKTGHLCGADTYQMGQGCQCFPCQRWLAAHIDAAPKIEPARTGNVTQELFGAPMPKE